MYLKDLQWNWDTYGKEDPLWAIATHPGKKNNKWDEDEFFATGERAIGNVVAKARALGAPAVWGTALDFGCGVGRLTQSLCRHFSQCVGVDIAPSMIEKAKEYNQYKHCHYVLNERPDLTLFKNDTFDFIYTEHVLQHIDPQISMRYIMEFVRVLRPSGLLAFHVPSDLARFEYPDQGLAAAIEAHVPYLVLGTDEKKEFPVSITNTGAHVWSPKAYEGLPLRLTAHWLLPDGTVVHRDHTRQALPWTMEPGDSRTLEFQVQGPAVPGHYALVLDVIDFNGGLFSDRGSDPCVVETVVKPGAKPEAPRGSAKRPHMDMHCLPVDVVHQLVAHAKGRVLETATSPKTPGSHVQSRYYVTK